MRKVAQLRVEGSHGQRWRGRCARGGATSTSASSSASSSPWCFNGDCNGRTRAANRSSLRQRYVQHCQRTSTHLVARSSGKDSIENTSSLEGSSPGTGGSRFAGRSNGKPDAAGSKSFNKRAATPQVRVRFKLQYRCHSRQMLAIAGSMSPLGWSFLSIARNPLVWREGDWWTIELNFPEGARLEYKYVVLEDQNWTKQADEAAEGLVPLYRPSGEVITDTEAIVRKMAIVAWQPGPNLVFTVPSQDDARRSGGEIFKDEDGDTYPVAEKLDLWT